MTSLESRPILRAAILGLLITIHLQGSAEAEPRFLSKQYTRCTSCHLSLTGGGLLTPYGRSLSRIELSLTGRPPAGTDPAASPSPGEDAFLWGAFGDALGPLQLGIELRPSHIRTSVAGQTFERDIVMNGDLIAAVQAGGWTFYGQVGREPASPGVTVDSYEHWIGYTSAAGLGFRAGRFLPGYGVRFADHTAFNRTALGFQQYDQVYGVELSRNTSRSVLQLTLAPGRAEAITDDDLQASFNGTVRFQYDLGASTTVVGSALYRGETDDAGRTTAAGAAFGFAPTRWLTVWTQGDFVDEREAGRSFVFVNETSVEVVRGLWLAVSPQVRTASGVTPLTTRWAFSAIVLPRTHWNVNLTYYRDRQESSLPVHVALVQIHLYL